MNSYVKNRLQAIKNLGGACVCCGEICETVLQIDHKNGDSCADKNAKRGVYFIVTQLAAGRDLERFQILCANCHRIKTTMSMCFGRNLNLRELGQIRSKFLKKGLAHLIPILTRSDLLDNIITKSNS